MSTQDFMQSKEVKDFSRDVQQYHLGPLWEALPHLMNHTPKPQAQAYLWKKELIEKKLNESAQIFTPEKGGERRVLYFQNPGLTNRQPWGWASATQTIYAGVQLLLPGEVAPSHRHSQNALRFITKGEGAYTIVQGQRVFIDEGDFLITPKGLWHGHEHLGDKPMIWMDALDIPMKYSIGGTFFDHYPDDIEKPSVPDNLSELKYQGGMVRPIADRKPSIAPLANYSFDRTDAAIKGLMNFDPDPYDGYAVEYINPSNGQTANPTMAAWMQHLPAGSRMKAHRHTHATIYCAFKGEGYSIIDGVRFDWSEGDYFVVPNWAVHEHAATKDSYLFSVSDLPIMEMFDIEEEYPYEENNGHQEVKSEFKPALP